MKCPICGSASSVLLKTEQPHEHRIVNERICERRHRFATAEVPLQLLADKRESDCAVRNIERRIARYQRDSRIAQDPRSAKVVAAEYNLTSARVRQIRASFPDRLFAPTLTKIA